MTEYGLNKQQLKELKRFSGIFNMDKDQLVLNCILVILCSWNEDKDLRINISPDISEIDCLIDLPKDIEDELYEFSDEYDLTIHDTINGILSFIFKYLNLNWSGEYGLESDDMTDQEKVIELTNENDDDCWNKFFG
jgi:hypothetical protein